MPMDIPMAITPDLADSIKVSTRHNKYPAVNTTASNPDMLKIAPRKLPASHAANIKK